MTRLFRRTSAPLVCGAFLVLLVGAAAPSFAAVGSGPTTVIGGFVPASQDLVPHGGQILLGNASQTPLGKGPLTYHGGPVMHANKSYAIYWVPSGYSVSANYRTLIDRYFGDVAAASGANTNVYSVLTQYYDNVNGNITTNSTFGGSVLDTNAFPSTNGCRVYTGVTKCLSDSQLRSEINRVIGAQGWTKNNTTEFFIFTPKNVGSCSGTSCAYTYFCAYHGYSSGLVYANQPYTVNSTYPNSCDTHQRPNGDDADPTINVTSHENREAINDTQLNAWYDSAGYEGSDKCAWIFGSVSGSSGAQYNQTINGHNYLLQEEYSNAGNACLQSYGSSSTPPPASTAPTISSFTPSSGLAGSTSAVITGTNFTNVNSVSIGSTAITGYSVDSSTQITAPIPSSALTGALTVVTNDGTATSSSSFGVLPRIDSFTPPNGPAGSTVTVNGNSFTGTTKVTLNGRSCSFTVVSNTQLTFRVPTFFASSGKIAVTTPGGTATSTTSFTIG